MSSITDAVPVAPSSNTYEIKSPYPGLRPFDRREVRIFFGRRRHKNEMLSLLRKVRFLGVVGTSGCGKSSLVKAGLIPELNAGWMLSSKVPWADATKYPDWVSSRWFIAEMRPGAHPFRALASALLDSGALGSAWDKSAPESVPALAARLQMGPQQLIRQCQQAARSPNGNLLILVDQFEELFRFREGNDLSLAQSFVRSLIQLAKQKDWPIYIVITMRSDFLGDCAQFPDLPEFLNEGQYLVPRLTTSEIQEAIEFPARMFGADFDELLVTKLLNDISNDSDQLPLLQHALKRMWELSADKRREHEQVSPESPYVLRIEDYDRKEIGGVTKALDLHAEELFQALPGDAPADYSSAANANAANDSGDKRIARILFQALTLQDRGREVRRPTSLSVIAAIAEVDEADVRRVADIFRHPDVSVLAPMLDRQLESDTKVDIAHESVIRKWGRLRSWIELEARWALQYRRLRDEVDNKARFIFDTHLDNAVEWKRDCHSNEHWALRYETAETKSPALYEAAISLIDRSVDERKRQFAAERRVRFLRSLLAIVSSIAVIAILASAIALHQRYLASESEALAKKNAAEAVASRETAAEEAKKAIESKSLADRASARAFSQAANEARKDGDWIRATHNFLNAANSLPREEDSSETLRNLVLATQFTSGNIIQTVPGFGTSALANRDSSLMLAWGGKSNTAGNSPDDGLLTVWSTKSGEKRGSLIHGDVIGGLVYSNNGSRVVVWSASSRGRVTVWDLPMDGSPVVESSSAPLLQFEQMEPVFGASFSPDDSKILTWGNDGFARLWTITSKERTRSSLEDRYYNIRHGVPITGAEFSKDGSRLLTAGGNTTQLWDVTTGTFVQSLEQSDEVVGAMFNVNHSRVLTWGRENSVRVWDATRSEVILKVDHEAPINGARFLQDGRVLTWSEDGKARVWDSSASEQLEPFNHRQPVIGARLSRNEKRLLIWGGTAACLWEMSHNLINTWKHEGSVVSALFDSDESRILSWSTDNSVRIWEAVSSPMEPRPIQVLGHNSTIHGAQFSNNDSEVLTWGSDASLKRWHVTHPRLLFSSAEVAGTAPISGAKMSKDDSTLLVWRPDLAKGTSIAAYKLVQDRFILIATLRQDVVSGALLSSDGRRVLAWCDRGRNESSSGVFEWDLQDPENPKSLDLSKDPQNVLGASWSQDETRLLTWGDGNTATLWERGNSIERRRSFQPHSSIMNGAMISSDGKKILTWGRDGAAKILDADSGEHLTTLLHPSNVRGATFSSNENRILTWRFSSDQQQLGTHSVRLYDENLIGVGSGRSEVTVWDDDDGKSPIYSVQHAAGVNGASCRDDDDSFLNDELLTWSDDGTAVLWDPDVEKQVFRHKDSVLGAKLLRGGSLVLTWSRDKTAALWDVSRSFPLAVFTHEDSVEGALTNRDDTRLLTWSRDGSVRWWDISLHDEHLTPDERMKEFQVRTATELNDAGEIVPLSESEWRKRSERLLQEKAAVPHTAP